MNWELILSLTAIMLFSYWFVYSMGSPLATNRDDVDIKAILFSIPYRLAVFRLHSVGTLVRWRDQLLDELSMTGEPAARKGLRNDNKLNTYLAGREFFTWERFFLCPICLHWWLSVCFGIICLSFDLLGAREDFFIACFTYLVNHLIIRKIS